MGKDLDLDDVVNGSCQPQAIGELHELRKACTDLREENALLLASNTALLGMVLREKNRFEALRRGFLNLDSMAEAARVNGG